MDISNTPIDHGRPGSLKRYTILKAQEMMKARAIHSIGALPYQLIRPVLHASESAEQLHLIETNSPHIIADDGECWRRLIIRDIPKYKDAIHESPPKDNDWYGFYCSLKKLDAQDEEAAKQMLRQRMQGIRREQAGNVSQKVEALRMPKPPRDPRLVANAGVLLSGRRSRGDAAPPKPKNAIDRARLEARQQAQMIAAAQKRIPINLAQIRKAPAGMVDAVRRESMGRSTLPPPRMPTEEELANMSVLDRKAAEVRARQAGDKIAEKMYRDAVIAEQIEKDREEPSSRSSSVEGQKPASAPKPMIKAPQKIMPPRKKAADIFLTTKKPVVAPKPATPVVNNAITRPPLILRPSPSGRGRPAMGPGAKNSAERAHLKPVGSVAERKGVVREHSDRLTTGLEFKGQSVTPKTSNIEAKNTTPSKPSVLSHISSIISREDTRNSTNPRKRPSPEPGQPPSAKRISTEGSHFRSPGPVNFNTPTYQINSNKRRADSASDSADSDNDNDNDSLFGSPPPESLKSKHKSPIRNKRMKSSSPPTSFASTEVSQPPVVSAAEKARKREAALAAARAASATQQAQARPSPSYVPQARNAGNGARRGIPASRENGNGGGRGGEGADMSVRPQDIRAGFTISGEGEDRRGHAVQQGGRGQHNGRAQVGGRAQGTSRGNQPPTNLRQCAEFNPERPAHKINEEGKPTEGRAERAPAPAGNADIRRGMTVAEAPRAVARPNMMRPVVKGDPFGFKPKRV